LDHYRESKQGLFSGGKIRIFNSGTNADEENTYSQFRDSKLTRLLQDSLGGNTKKISKFSKNFKIFKNLKIFKKIKILIQGQQTDPTVARLPGREHQDHDGRLSFTCR